MRKKGKTIKQCLSIAVALFTMFSCSNIAAYAYDHKFSDKGHGVGLTASANEGSSSNQTTTSATSSSSDYETNANYYELWKEYSNIFRNPGSVQQGFFDSTGRFVKDENGLFATGDSHFYEVDDFTVSKEQIEKFLESFRNKWEDRFSSFSRYTTSTWQNTFNNNFKNVTNSKIYDADKNIYTAAISGLSSSKYTRTPSVTTASSNPISPDSLLQLLFDFLLPNRGSDFADRFYDDFESIAEKFDRSELDRNFSDFLNSIYDSKETSDKGQDLQRWIAMDEIISEMFTSGEENIDFQSLTEYIISDYEEGCMDNTEWEQLFDWGVCGYSSDVNASEDNAMVSWDTPLYYLALNEEHSSISVCFNTAGTYFISCAQHCNLVKQTKIEYVYQQYVYLMPYKLCVYVGNSFDNDNNWTKASTLYLDESVEVNTTYNIGEFAVHVTDDMVGKELMINSKGDNSSSYTTQRIS